MELVASPTSERGVRGHGMPSLSALTPPSRCVQDTALQTASPAALRRGGMDKGFLETTR